MQIAVELAPAIRISWSNLAVSMAIRLDVVVDLLDGFFDSVK